MKLFRSLSLLTCILFACSTAASTEAGCIRAIRRSNQTWVGSSEKSRARLSCSILRPTASSATTPSGHARASSLPRLTKSPTRLIALETGVASGPDFPLAWNSSIAPRQPWWPVWAKDHTLRTALANSVVWYYQELARRIGAKRMQEYVNRFGYGNREISGGIDQFWLTGGLLISAEEQIDFLRRFYFGKLNVSERGTRIVKDLLVLEETPNYRLSGKTGWAGPGETSAPQIGWLAAYIERFEKVYFFAINIDIEQKKDAAARLLIAKAILRIE